MQAMTRQWQGHEHEHGAQGEHVRGHGHEQGRGGFTAVADRVSGSLILRVALGAVLLPHGAQHLFGWFGGYGLSGTAEFMSSALGVPEWFAMGAILFEFAGPLALIAGLWTRAVAGLMAVFMLVAASTHFGNGLFMNWFGTMPAGVEGFEFHVLAIALSLALVVQGGGPFSVDGARRARR